MADFESLFPYEPVDMVELAVEIGGTAFSLTHANTEIYTYRRHPEVNHIYHVYYLDHAEKNLAVFSCMPLIEQLRELCFSERIQSRPTEWDEKAYAEYQANLLDVELRDLLEE